jgi:drug/metabolite transporter (DMT)-like permease
MTASREVLIGVGFMLIGVSLLPAMNTAAKYLATDYPLWQVVWARFLGHLLWMTLFFGPRLGVALYRTAHLKDQMVRSIIFLASNALFISALPHVGLATASAVMFTTPLIVVALSAPMLGERIGVWKWSAVAVGFAGALVIIRPGTRLFEPAALLVLGSACCFGLYQLWTRRLATRERPETMIVYTALAGAALTTAIVPWIAIGPRSGFDLAAFAAVGLLGGTAQNCIIRALQRAPASLISPIGYAELLSATMFGFAVFGDIPDRYTWLGAALIIASGLFMVYGASRIRAQSTRGRVRDP